MLGIQDIRTLCFLRELNRSDKAVEADLRRLIEQALVVINGGIEAWNNFPKVERVAIALVLDRPDLIKEDGLTLAKAVDMFTLYGRCCGMLTNVAEDALLIKSIRQQQGAA